MKLARMLPIAVVLVGASAAATPPDKILIAVCSPGSPGSTAEAQPAMDAFAAAAGAKAGAPIAAVYDEAEDAGVARVKTASIAMVSLPFFLKHETELKLHARLVAVPKGHADLDTWTLVAGKGRVTGAASLASFTIVANAAFAPAFVRGSVLGAFGALPDSVKWQQSTAVLSALRRAANGEAVAAVLDGSQGAALASLPFADKLETVARSPAMPAGVIATIDARISDKAWAPIEAALVGMRADKAGATALDGIRMDKLAPVDDKVLATARKAYAGASAGAVK